MTKLLKISDLEAQIPVLGNELALQFLFLHHHHG